MKAISFAVPYPCDSGSGLASVTFRPAPLDVGSVPYSLQHVARRLHHHLEELSHLYISSVKKLMAQNKQYDLPRHIVANHQGFLLNVDSFHSVIDTCQ